MFALIYFDMGTCFYMFERKKIKIFKIVYIVQAMGVKIVNFLIKRSYWAQLFFRLYWSFLGVEPLNILCFLATVAKKRIYPNNELCGIFILVEKASLVL